MRVMIPVTDDVAMAAIMQEFAFNGVKYIGKKKFREIVSDYIFGYGQICIDDHQSDYGHLWDDALKIVNKHL